MKASDPTETIFGYHERSKHDFQAFAPGPGGLDWENQPNPFRTYEGARTVPLGVSTFEQGFSPYYESSLLASSEPLTEVCLASISRLFFDSLALSAWKSFQGKKWALRVNPSSGNLHPTEGYWISGPIPGISDSPFVAHYRPLEHSFEVRAEIPWKTSTRGPLMADLIGYVGLASIHWREAWKYGMRAYRYCQHDVGHAIAAVSVAAAGLGWRAQLVDQFSHEDIRNILGLSTSFGKDPTGDAEIEHPDCLIAITATNSLGSIDDLSDWLKTPSQTSWRGKPNRLSVTHRNWPEICEVAHGCEKPRTVLPSANNALPRLTSTHSEPVSLRTLIHQRRSAVDFDGQKAITRKAFYDLLEKTLPAQNRVPWNTLPWVPQVHLGIYVHRVETLDPGLYFLIRNPEHHRELRSSMSPEFLWEKPEGCPPDLDIYRLLIGDARQLAMRLSCGQAIAGDGVLSLGMIARFEKPLVEMGPWFYPRLFWECGAIGQMLYLEAEAIGLRGTGIGCFFDDPVHRSFSLKDRTYQSLYHFTLGNPLEDHRLSTLPAY